MCSTTELVPIPDYLWAAGAIYDFDPAHPEYGVNEQGERCLAIDSCIVPAVRALWSIGMVTRSCCCLHGEGYGVITLARSTPSGTDA